MNKTKNVILTYRQLEVLEIVFDQLCCDHFVAAGPPPYSFEDIKEEFEGLLDLFTISDVIYQDEVNETLPEQQEAPQEAPQPGMPQATTDPVEPA